MEINFGWAEMLKTVWRFLDRKERRDYIIGNVILFLVSFYNLFPTFMIGLIVDFFHRYLYKGGSLKLFYWYTAIWGITYIIFQLSRLKVKNILRKTGLSANEKIRLCASTKILNASLQKHFEESTGKKLQRIATGSNAITELIKFLDQRFYPIITSFIGIFFAYLFLKPAFLLFLSAYAAIFFKIEASFSQKDKDANDQCNDAREKALGFIGDFISNAVTIKAMGAKKYVYDIIMKCEREARDVLFKKADIGTNKRYCFHMLTGFATSIFLLLVCREVIKRNITIGMCTVLLSYFSRIKKCANESTTAISEAIAIRSDIGRIIYLLTGEIAAANGNQEFPAFWDKLIIENGRYVYANGIVGLENLNFTIWKGEKIGIAGTSGGGKTTFVKILLGLLTPQGIFKIGEQNFEDILRGELTTNIIAVLQDTEVFHLSLRENITLCPREEMNLCNLEKAIEIAALEEVIDGLQNGYEATLVERGDSLSGGQRQRVNIARAAYKLLCRGENFSGILIMDEATSALDSLTEERVIGDIFRKFKDCTIIVISHRPAPLRMCDRIIKIKGGKIV